MRQKKVKNKIKLCPSTPDGNSKKVDTNSENFLRTFTHCVNCRQIFNLGSNVSRYIVTCVISSSTGEQRIK